MRKKHEYIDEEERKRAVLYEHLRDFIEFLFCLSFLGIMMDLFGRFLNSAIVGFLLAGAIIVFYYNIRDID